MARARQLKLSVFEDESIAELSHGAFRLLVGIWQLCNAEGWLEVSRRVAWRHVFSLTSTTEGQASKLFDELIERGQLVAPDPPPSSSSDSDSSSSSPEGLPLQSLFFCPSFRAHQSPHPREASTIAGTSRDRPVPAGTSSAGCPPGTIKNQYSVIKNQGSKKRSRAEDDASFEALVGIYPNNANRKDARSLWGRLSLEDQRAAYTGCSSQLKWGQEFTGLDVSAGRNPPALNVWLRGRRWEDEPPTKAKQRGDTSPSKSQRAEAARRELILYGDDLIDEERERLERVAAGGDA